MELEEANAWSTKARIPLPALADEPGRPPRNETVGSRSFFGFLALFLMKPIIVVPRHFSTMPEQCDKG
jgi:hypothetical protein